MRILITGGCGFIGVNLIHELLKLEGWVRVVDNLSVGRLQDLALLCEVHELNPEELSHCPGGRVELVVGDIRDRELMLNACKGMDVVVHLAANTGVLPSIEDPFLDCTTNVIGTLNCLEAAKSCSAKRFVFASSGAPLGEQIPPIHEKMTPRPVSPYGASKLAGEGYCSAYFHSFGLETVALRFGNVYGPRSGLKNSVVAKFIKHILAGDDLPIFGDGSQTRDYIHVQDLVGAVLAAIKTPGLGGDVFQIATHREHTVYEVAHVLNTLAKEYLGRQSRVVHHDARKGEVRRNYSDISKARQLLSWSPVWDFENGLRDTFKWFVNQYPIKRRE